MGQLARALLRLFERRNVGIGPDRLRRIAARPPGDGCAFTGNPDVVTRLMAFAILEGVALDLAGILLADGLLDALAVVGVRPLQPHFGCAIDKLVWLKSSDPFPHR